MAKYFAGGIIVRLERDDLQVLRVLVNQYEDGVFIEQQSKFPGGTEKCENESPKDTIYREMIEETGLELLNGWSVCQIPKEKDLLPGQHFQRYFLIPPDGYKGNLREDVIWDNDQNGSSKEELLPPDWQNVWGLKGGVMFGRHAIALREALEWMSQNKDFRYQYPDLSKAAALLLV